MTLRDEATGAIDLRPLFAPRSVAVVGASPRSWIAGTVRDNLKVMDSATRCHFVNPNYEELHGQPCYPSLDALPELDQAELAPGDLIGQPSPLAGVVDLHELVRV